MSSLVDELLAVLHTELPDAPAGVHRRVVAALCARCGGAKVYVPSRLPDESVRLVAAAIARGATIAEAAHEAGVSERHARRLRRRSPA